MDEKEIKTDTIADTIPFFPDHIRTEAWVTLGILVVVFIIGVWGMFSPVGLEEPADPMNTPEHVKPEWYFLALYQILKFEFITPTLGALIPITLAGIVLLWPFFDRKPEKSKKVQRVRFIVIAIGMIILIALTFWGGMI